MKRVFIVHGWGGFPNEGWFPWLKKELQKKGFQVKVLSMPDADNPKIKKWVGFLSKNVKKADSDTYFVGHSIGCQTIMRYLQTIKGKIGGAVFVAGWFHLKGLETKAEENIAKPWLKTKIDFSRLRNKGRYAAIFSEDDYFVPLSDAKAFKRRLGAKITIEKNKGHFSGSDGVKKLPVALKELIAMIKK